MTGLIPWLFVPRAKDSFRSKLDGVPAVISSFAMDEAKGIIGVIVTESGPSPAVNGELAMTVSAPVLGSIVYPETLPTPFAK